MTHVWIVTGHTGVYEDAQWWIEGVYETQEEAIGRADKLNALLDALGAYDATLMGGLDYDRSTEIEEALREQDELVRVDYNGAHYSYQMVHKKKWPA